jgi:hypothetical protein
MAVPGQPPLGEPFARAETVVRPGAVAAPQRTSLSATVQRLGGPVFAVGVFGLLLGLAVANGGFFPTSWGWAALPAFALAAVLALAGVTETPTRLELAFLGSFALLVGWIWLSVAWTSSVTTTALEGERAVVLLAGVSVVLAAGRARACGPLLAGIAAASFGACSYGLATRLFPERLGTFDPLAGYRLAEPIGYWNGVGIFAAIGLVLCVGFAVRARTPPGRALGAAAMPPLAVALYFTFSRGSIVALLVGLAAAVALDPRRLQLLGAVLVVSPATALALLAASHSPALTHRNVLLAHASHEGHRLALLLPPLAALSAALALAFASAEHRLRVPRAVRVAFAALLVVCALAALAGTFGRYGSPPALVRHAYHSFRAPPSATNVDLNRRLLTISSGRRYNLWKVAWGEARAHPVLGGGAGSFGQVWLLHRHHPFQVEDAHSLYLETLAEVGVIGLALLLVALALPLVAAVRARRHPLVPFACAGFVAFLVHAALDWDWELPAVTLAALFCGLACFLGLRGLEGAPRTRLAPRLRLSAAAAGLVLAAGAAVMLLGNAAVGTSKADAAAGRFGAAKQDAFTAIRWTPWLSLGWQQLGEAQLGLGQLAGARRSLRTAIAKDPRNWVLWLDLAAAERGFPRERALRTALRLNPYGPEIRAFVAHS